MDSKIKILETILKNGIKLINNNKKLSNENKNILINNFTENMEILKEVL